MIILDLKYTEYILEKIQSEVNNSSESFFLFSFLLVVASAKNAYERKTLFILYYIKLKRTKKIKNLLNKKMKE